VLAAVRLVSVVVLPALIMVLKLNPLSAKKAALLGAMVRQDVEMVADVFAFTDEVRDLRNRLQTILVNEANASLGKEDEAKTELSNDDSAALAAKQMFDRYAVRLATLLRLSSLPLPGRLICINSPCCTLSHVWPVC
jgi:hypothetical protein